MTDNLRGLTRHLVVSLLVIGVIVLIAPLAGLQLQPVPWVVIAIIAGLAVWIVRRGTEPADPPSWPEHQADVVTPRSQVDLRTERLANHISSAQPGRAFTTQQLATTLSEVAASRLVRHRGADPRDPFAGAERWLSRALLDYLDSADADHSPTINRSTLHRFLKEITEL